MINPNLDARHGPLSQPLRACDAAVFTARPSNPTGTWPSPHMLLESDLRGGVGGDDIDEAIRVGVMREATGLP